MSNYNCNKSEMRLLRYLYVGKEYADYHPGNWFVHDYFVAQNVSSIEELAENPEKQLIPIQLITKVEYRYKTCTVAYIVKCLLLQICIIVFNCECISRHLRAILSRIQRPWCLLLLFAAGKWKARNYVTRRTKIWKRFVHRPVSSFSLSNSPLSWVNKKNWPWTVTTGMDGVMVWGKPLKIGISLKSH